MFLTTFLWSQLLVTPEYPTQDFSGKTIVVTGSNTGLGLEAARHFVRLNCAKLILAVRTVSKGEEAKESIITSESRDGGCVEVWELDQTNNASVKAFAKRVQSLERVDAVVENAGVMTDTFRLAEGFEEIIQVNVIATFLLALLLLPKLRETAQKFSTRTNLAIISSEVHHMNTVAEADSPDLYTTLNDPKRTYDGGER
jgi:retinol dehydrogenase-12